MCCIRLTAIGAILAITAVAAHDVGLTPRRSPVSAAEPEPLKVEVYRGKVVPLAEALKKRGIELDQDVHAHWLALQTDDGKLYPLVKDAGARMFFNDKTLLNRPMSLRGRLVAWTSLLQVLQVQSLKEGKPHDVYYWCEVCAIKRFSLEKTGVCECCGGQMELREVPTGK